MDKNTQGTPLIGVLPQQQTIHQMKQGSKTNSQITCCPVDATAPRCDKDTRVLTSLCVIGSSGAELGFVPGNETH